MSPSPVKTPGGSHTVQFGETPIRFEVLYSARKTIGLRVYPDLHVEVDAPLGSEQAAIADFVHRRGAWVLKQQRELSDFARPATSLPRRYVSGETFRYLGRQYRLKVVEGQVERVVLSRGRLEVGVKDAHDSRRVASLVKGWYRARAERLFAERLAVCHERVAPLGIPIPRLAVREMKVRWGSCSGKGTISLNLKLIQAPRSLIDYVILHELCHLRERGHGPRFRALMDRVLPGWQRLREELNRYEFGEDWA